MVLVYVSNLRLLGCFILVYFGGGSSCSCCSDRGKTKSTPSPRLWTLDWSLTMMVQKKLRGKNVGSQRVNMGGVGLMSVGEVGWG